MTMTKIGRAVQADVASRRAGGCRQYEKRLKARAERRRAKSQPDCQHGYGRYNGWLT